MQVECQPDVVLENVPSCMPDNLVTRIPIMSNNIVTIRPDLPHDNRDNSFLKEMMEIERAKKQAQRVSEINASILSLKTNLVLCSLCIIFVAFQRALNETVMLLSLSLFKSLIPILTSAINFRKIKIICYFFRTSANWFAFMRTILSPFTCHMPHKTQLGHSYILIITCTNQNNYRIATIKSFQYFVLEFQKVSNQNLVQISLTQLKITFLTCFMIKFDFYIRAYF